MNRHLNAIATFESAKTAARFIGNSQPHHGNRFPEQSGGLKAALEVFDGTNGSISREGLSLGENGNLYGAAALYAPFGSTNSPGTLWFVSIREIGVSSLNSW